MPYWWLPVLCMLLSAQSGFDPSQCGGHADPIKFAGNWFNITAVLKTGPSWVCITNGSEHVCQGFAGSGYSSVCEWVSNCTHPLYMYMYRRDLPFILITEERFIIELPDHLPGSIVFALFLTRFP